jgi:hypothetical protein
VTPDFPVFWAMPVLLGPRNCIDINYEDKHGRTPVSRAAEKGYEVVVTFDAYDHIIWCPLCFVVVGYWLDWPVVESSGEP